MHEVFGTIENGEITLDTPLPIQEPTRVKLTIEPVETKGFDPVKARAAWERIKQRLTERPIHGGGEKFNREELYDRH